MSTGLTTSTPSWRVWAYALTAVLGVVVFLPNLTGYFTADDWPVIARNANIRQEGLRLFTHVRYGWYRPLFDLFIALCWELFGLNPVGYHLIVILLYAAVSVAVGILAEVTTGDRRVGVLSTGLFAIHGSHAEPVLWIASANEVLAGLCVVLAMATYTVFRRHGKYLWLLASWACYLLGIASKETAIFLPLMMLVYDSLLYSPPDRQSGWRALVPTVPFFAVGAAFAIFRLLTRHPYSTAVPLWRVGANLVYYAAVEVFALPDNYGYLSALSLWLQEPLLPIVTVGFATGSLVVLTFLLLKLKKGELRHRYSRALIFGASWSLVALSPVLLTATGRTAFLSSVGVAWSLAILLVLLWLDLPRPEYRRWVLVALALLVSANLLVSTYRVYWWRRAGDTSRGILTQLSDRLADIQVNATVWLINLPDHLRHAYTFRNAFPAVGRLIFPGRNIRVVLDVELQGLAKQHAIGPAIERIDCTDCVILWYEEGTLESVQ